MRKAEKKMLFSDQNFVLFLKDYAHIPLLKKNNKKIRMKQGQDQEVLGDLLNTDEEDSLGRERKRS